MSEQGVTDDDFELPVRMSDDVVVNVPVKRFKDSKIIGKMVVDLGITKDNVNDSSPIIFEVDSKIFSKVLQWCNGHESNLAVSEIKFDEDPVSKERKWHTLNDFENKFFELPLHKLMELITAANYLEVRNLYQLSCQTLAKKIKDANTPEKIRDLLVLEDDLTEKDKEELNKKNVWCNY